MTSSHVSFFANQCLWMTKMGSPGWPCLRESRCSSSASRGSGCGCESWARLAPQPDAGHGLWADSKGSGRGCVLLELAGLEVAPVAKGLISSTLLVHAREHLVREQHGQHGPDVFLLFAVEHHGFEPVQWGPVGVLAQVGPNVSGLWDSILSSLADAGQASDVAGASGFRVPGQLASIQSREGVVQKEATHPAASGSHLALGASPAA